MAGILTVTAENDRSVLADPGSQKKRQWIWIQEGQDTEQSLSQTPGTRSVSIFGSGNICVHMRFLVDGIQVQTQVSHTQRLQVILDNTFRIYTMFLVI